MKIFLGHGWKVMGDKSESCIRVRDWEKSRQLLVNVGRMDNSTESVSVLFC